MRILRAIARIDYSHLFRVMRPSRDGRPGARKAPKQARSLETVGAIVEATARILEEFGHDGFTTNAVAERAGVSVGSLYQYFPRKDALVGALIVREASLLIEDATIAVSRPSGCEALAAFIAACVAHQFRRPKLARLLDFEEARLPFDPETEKIGKRINELVVQMLGRRDLPHQADRHIAARDVVAIVKGMIDVAGTYEERDREALQSRVERAAFGYLANPHG